MDNNQGGRQATTEEHHEIERRPPSPAREETLPFPIPRPCVSKGKMSRGSRWGYPNIPPEGGFHRGWAPREGSNFFEGPLPGLLPGGQDLLRTCSGPEEHHEIELMKQKLLPSMSQDIEAAPKLLTESASESSCSSESSDQEKTESSRSIFRVPEAIGGGIAEACRPRIVSIGPYHHGEQQLQMLQKHKWSYLRTMLDQTQPQGVGLEDLINTVAPKVEMIRQCYSESTECFSGLDLVKMMVVDGCFIIQFLRQFVGFKRMDPPLYNSYVGLSVARDLLRLENQVPYFVLEDLFETINVQKIVRSLDNLVSTFFSYLSAIAGNDLEMQIDIKGVHLLDSFRRSLIPQGQQDNLVEKSSYISLIKSTSELHRLGIGFKQGQANTILEIKFDKERTIVRIPQIAMNDDLNCILSNMVAFEQCRGQFDRHITAYAMFMGCLIHTVDDVQLLCDRKVKVNDGMSNRDVAHFFSNIYKESTYIVEGMYLQSHFLFLFSDESFKYERASFCWAQLLNAVHDNPWSTLSGLAVVVTLVGIIQTVYAVLQYYHPK